MINGSTVSAGQLMDVETPSALLLNIQILEYLRAFLLGRSGCWRCRWGTIERSGFALPPIVPAPPMIPPRGIRGA